MTGPGALTVLYDAKCPLCSAFRDWLARQPAYLPVHLVAAASEEARERFPALDHTATLRDISIVGDDGAVWTREHAWVVALWATRAHRPLAERLAQRSWLPTARITAATAAGLRHLLAPTPTTFPVGPAGPRRPAADGGGDYPEPGAGPCAVGCAAHPQG